LENISEEKLDENLRSKIGYNKGFLNGKTLVTLCDSMGDNRAWQQRIADLTGAKWSLALNNNHYSKGGTKTLYAPQQSNDGQGRAKMLYDDYQNGLITPDVIIYQNVNDNSGLETGASTDEPFFRTLQEIVSVGSVPASLADAETYWQNNLASIVGNYTPDNGVILGVPYTSNNGVKVKITGTPAQDGTLVFRFGSGYGYTLTLKTTDTISDIVRKLLEYDYSGYIDIEDPNDSDAVIFTNMDKYFDMATISTMVGFSKTETDTTIKQKIKTAISEKQKKMDEAANKDKTTGIDLGDLTKNINLGNITNSQN
jgi:hypothetical protein